MHRIPFYAFLWVFFYPIYPILFVEEIVRYKRRSDIARVGRLYSEAGESVVDIVEW